MLNITGDVTECKYTFSQLIHIVTHIILSKCHTKKYQ